MMGQSDDNFDTPQLDYEAWRDLLRAMCGRYNPEGIEPNAFTGWVRPVSVCGLTALDIGCNAHWIERTYLCLSSAAPHVVTEMAPLAQMP
jgi:AraC family transcriptional activator of tynA and feaB